jgi:F-type H+-transporting ATPase subunit a
MSQSQERRYGSPMEQFELVPMVPNSRGEAREGRRVSDDSVEVRRRRLDSRHMVMEVVQGTTQGSRMMMGVRRMGKRTWGRMGSGKVLPSGRGSRREGREGGRVDRVRQSMGSSGEKFVVVLKSVIEAVRRRNRRGMVPYSYSMTAQLVVTRRRARSVWIWKRWRGVSMHGRSLLGRRRPRGTPLAMVPMRVGLERRGFCITCVSLSVRLFANRMAGHILLKVLGGFGWVRRLGTEVRGMVPLVVVRRLMRLETAVACIQAYVFVLLRCIYIGDMRKGGH